MDMVVVFLRIERVIEFERVRICVVIVIFLGSEGGRNVEGGELSCCVGCMYSCEGWCIVDEMEGKW